MRPYYADEWVTLYCGDCREITPSLTASGLLVCDPPYGIEHSTSYGATWQNTRIANDHSTELRDWIIAFFPPEMPKFVFGTWKMPKPEGTRATLIWDKGPAFGMGDLTFPWKNSFEEIYVLGEGFEGHRDEAVYRGHMVVSWESRGRVHPHEKPVSLLGALIDKVPHASIVDPCCGTGPVLRAAKDRNRKAIGIEMNEAYCEIAAQRLSQETLDLTA